MKSGLDQLSKYAQYHRDRRNIATHLVGVPMIVFAVIVLLSRPSFEVSDSGADNGCQRATYVRCCHRLLLRAQLRHLRRQQSRARFQTGKLVLRRDDDG